MYAVIETGGKQYKVGLGSIIQIEKIEGIKGQAVTFDKVLFIREKSDEQAVSHIGHPYLPDTTVKADILAQGRDKKIIIMKMKRRKQYRRTQGHRQDQTIVFIHGIENQSGSTLHLTQEEKEEKTRSFYSQLEPRFIDKVNELLYFTPSHQEPSSLDEEDLQVESLSDSSSAEETGVSDLSTDSPSRESL